MMAVYTKMSIKFSEHNIGKPCFVLIFTNIQIHFFLLLVLAGVSIKLLQIQETYQMQSSVLNFLIITFKPTKIHKVFSGVQNGPHWHLANTYELTNHNNHASLIICH